MLYYFVESIVECCVVTVEVGWSVHQSVNFCLWYGSLHKRDSTEQVLSATAKIQVE